MVVLHGPSFGLVFIVTYKQNPAFMWCSSTYPSKLKLVISSGLVSSCAEFECKKLCTFEIMGVFKIVALTLKLSYLSFNVAIGRSSDNRIVLPLNVSVFPFNRCLLQIRVELSLEHFARILPPRL